MKKLVVVSGGSQGIGRAIVHTFARQGYAVATCGRTATTLDALKQDLARQCPDSELYTCIADLAERAGVATFAQLVKGLPYPPEVLIHNTGVFLPGGILEEPEGQFEQLMHTNVYSSYYLTRALVPAMAARQQGHIFIIASIASLVGYATGGSYAISKHAQLGLARVLREELKPQGIRVTAVMPGAVYTRSWEGMELPRERFMKPEDIAETVWATYALSDRTVVEEIVLRPQQGDI